MKAVAEGIETTYQVHQLRPLGCHFAQGFYFSPPLPAKQLLPLLQANMPYANLVAIPAQPPLALTA
jgi:EAL domain-containing protein (putative c-di-GMP-specific phosphodiesterase class I)